MRHKYSLICAHCGHPFHPHRRTARYCGRSCANRANHAARDRDIATRLWQGLDRGASPDACWRWTGAHNDNGYGKIRCEGRSHSAHRLAWELTHGPIPAGLFVCHHCDVRDCVRPDHLFLGTPADNSADRDRKQRHAHGERHYARSRPGLLSRGENHGRAKLTVEQVRALRQERAAGVSLHVLAQRFGVDKSVVSRIALRRLWRHVD